MGKMGFTVSEEKNTRDLRILPVQGYRGEGLPSSVASGVDGRRM